MVFTIQYSYNRDGLERVLRHRNFSYTTTEQLTQDILERMLRERVNLLRDPQYIGDYVTALRDEMLQNCAVLLQSSDTILPDVWMPRDVQFVEPFDEQRFRQLYIEECRARASRLQSGRLMQFMSGAGPADFDLVQVWNSVCGFRPVEPYMQWKRSAFYDVRYAYANEVPLCEASQLMEALEHRPAPLAIRGRQELQRVYLTSEYLDHEEERENARLAEQSRRNFVRERRRRWRRAGEQRKRGRTSRRKHSRSWRRRNSRLRRMKFSGQRRGSGSRRRQIRRSRGGKRTRSRRRK